MKDVIELMKSVPFLLQFFVPGYVFVTVYSFMRYKEPNKGLDHLFFKTTAISAILLGLINLLPFAPLRAFTADMSAAAPGWKGYVAVLCLAVLGGALGYLAGLLAGSNAFKTLLRKLRVHRTPNSNVWYDIFKTTGQWVCFYEKGTDIRYFGLLNLFEDDAREPILLLRRYQILDMDGKVVNDYRNDNNAAIVLDAKNARRIEIIYPKKPQKPAKPKKK